MSNDIKEAIVGAGIVILSILLLVGILGAANYFLQHQTDQYCKTTPLYRIDRERCGIREEK